MKLLLIIYFLTNISFAKEIDLPSYSIFLEGQFKCSDSTWKNLPWDKNNRDIWNLAYKSFSVVGSIELKEIENKDEKLKKIGKLRYFDLSYIAYAQIACTKESETSIEGNGKGSPRKELPLISYAWQRKGFIDLASTEDPYAFKSYMSFSLTPFGGDEPNLNRKGLEGFSCLVDVKDFIKDPLGKINIDRLCEGESKNTKEKVKKNILKVAETIKNASTQMKK
jgi:hypothetical protein